MKRSYYVALASIILFPIMVMANHKEDGFYNALEKGDTVEVQSLLKKDPSLANAHFEHGITPLMIAASKARGTQFEKWNYIVKLLLAAGANPEATTEPGETVLEFAKYANESTKQQIKDAMAHKVR